MKTSEPLPSKELESSQVHLIGGSSITDALLAKCEEDCDLETRREAEELE